MRRGYGLMVTKAREAAGLDVDALAARIGRSPSTVRRIESEETEPSVEQINALVAALPLSAEELLRAMGVTLNTPAAAKLPRDVVNDLLIVMQNPEGAAIIRRIAHGLRLSLEGTDG